MAEREMPHPNLEPKIRQDQKPSLRPAEALAKGGFERQARSPLDEVRYQFVTKVWANNVHMSRTGGISRKVLERQNDIIKRCILEGESEENVGQGYERDIHWVNRELREGLGRFWSNSPEDVRMMIAREIILPTRTRVVKERTQNQDRDIISKLTNPNSDKEQLRKIKPKIGGRFYSRHKGLFMRLPKLIKNSGLLRTTPASFAVEVLEQEGGVVVFSYHGGKKIDGSVKTCHFVLIHDVKFSVDTLTSSEKLEDYQDSY